MTASIFNRFMKVAGVVCIATAFVSSALVIRGLVVGQVPLVTNSAETTFVLAENPTGFWIMEGIYASGALILFALGAFGLRTK
jgi:hypothetical protein